MIPTLIAASLAAQALHGQALLDDVSRRAFDYFWNESPAPTYFTRDRAPVTGDWGTREKAPASIAAVGYALAACAVGANRNWVTREQALERADDTVDAVLEKAESSHGWYYHFIDASTGRRQWNCEVSTIDTSLLLNGLMLAEGYFRDAGLARRAKKLYDRIDWKFMLTDDGAKPASLFFTMGWKPVDGFIPARWDAYDELPHLYFAAYSLWDDMPAESWDKWDRKQVRYEGYDFFLGGPLFLHQMPQGFYDLRGQRDRLGYDYWVGGRNATLAQRLYCEKNVGGFKGYSNSIWGLSACDNPDGYNANGAPVDVNDNGTLAPVSATASVIFTPSKSLEATEAFIQAYPACYGRYGFVTGMNPSKDWYSPDVIGIDLGQAMLDIENARDGSPWNWMMAQERVKAAFKKMGFHKTEEGPLEARKLKAD